FGDKSFPVRAYPVLAQVSLGCSEPKGTFPRVTLPSATPVLPRAFDLHVLGLPPAFALSQDQTLKLDENFSRPITTFDEVPPASCGQVPARDFHRTHDRRRHEIGVDLKRRPPKSRPAAARSRTVPLARQNLDRASGAQGPRRPRFSFFRFTCQTARNQGGPTLRCDPESRRSPRLPIRGEACSPLSVRSFEDAPSRGGGGEPN